MNIALIVPNYMCSKTFLQPPIELYTAATILESKGHNVDVFDFRVIKMTSYEATKYVGDLYDVIIISVSPYDMTQMYHMDYRYRYVEYFAKTLKQSWPQTVVFAEGAQCTLKPDVFLKNTEIDGVILWEIERTVSELIDAIEENKLEEVHNIVLRDKTGRIKYILFEQQTS